MKRVILTAIAALIATASLSGCTDGGVTKENQDLAIEKNAFEVTITLPAEVAELFGLNANEGLDTLGETSGTATITSDDNGTITVKMPSDAHEKWMNDLEAETTARFEDIVAESQGMVQKISYNDDMTKFDVNVDRGLYESLADDQILLIQVSAASGMYRLFSGAPSGQEWQIEIVDGATGDVISSDAMPKESEETGEE